MDIKNFFVEVKQALKDIEKGLDLKLRFPGYFNQKIFRTFFFFFLIFFIYAWSLQGFSFNSQYLECPVNSVSHCENLLYNSFACNNIFCEKKFLEPGEIIGDKPPRIVINFEIYTYILIFLSFVTNHLFYCIKYKSLFYRREKHEI